jgi:hypothetical protein
MCMILKSKLVVLFVYSFSDNYFVTQCSIYNTCYSYNLHFCIYQDIELKLVQLVFAYLELNSGVQ